MATKFEYEYRKEQIEQQIRDIDLSILEVKKDIKANDLEAVKWDLEKSREGIRRSRLGYEQAKVSNDIAEEKLTQLQDQLEFERAMTGVNRESLLTAGKSALLGLEEAQQQLEENSALFELKYRKNPALNSFLGG